MPIFNTDRIPRGYERYRAAMGTGNEAPRVTINWNLGSGGPAFRMTAPTYSTVTVTNETNAEPMAEWERELLAQSTEREEEEVPSTIEPPRRRCHGCGAEEDPAYRFINWSTINNHDYCHGCVTRCSNCGEVHAGRNAFGNRGGFCEDCTMRCWNCSNPVENLRAPGNPIEWVERDGYLWNERVHCRHCIGRCPGCGGMEPINDMVTVSDSTELYCEECCNYCDDCDNYNVGACGCQSTDRVRGYGHTAATMWLGGPLPHDEYDNENGYFVGFELEIGAQAPDGRRHIDVGPIKDWAEANLTSREALDCKHDGSVQGFEIASQPMTPAFFESVDWESFMNVLNDNYPLAAFGWEDEPREHGLHVHIGRVAFRRDDVAQAAYSYLLSQDNHLERIGRREAYHYCSKVMKPVSASITQSKPYGRQGQRLRNQGIGHGRDAVNLTNQRTIEIRAFKSTRSANELRDAVRVTYLAAEYIRELRSGGWKATSQALHWLEFAAWVGANYPQAFASISGMSGKPGSNKFPEPPQFWA